MKRQQMFVAGTGVLLLIALYFFGNTVPPQKKTVPSEGGAQGASISRPISTQEILQASQSKLTPTQLEYVTRLQHAVVRGDVKDQQIHADRSLATFWRDSVQNGFLPFAYYTAEAAKLENSEKSLTFAAQLFLGSLRAQENPAIKSWMATNAKE